MKFSEMLASAPVIYKNKIFVRSEEKNIYFIEANKGEILNKITINTYVNYEFEPAVAYNSLFVPTEEQIYSLPLS